MRRPPVGGASRMEAGPPGPAVESGTDQVLKVRRTFLPDGERYHMEAFFLGFLDWWIV